MAIPVTVVHLIPGGDAVELGTVATGVSFSTAAVGGFGDCTVTLPGDLRKRLGYLGMVRLYLGTALLWEGQLEDKSWKFAAESIETTFRAFGLKRKLEETSVRRIWSKRDLALGAAPGGVGSDIGLTILKTSGLTLDTGTFDPTDLTKTGVQIAGNGTALTVGVGIGAQQQMAIGATVSRLLGTCVLSGANTGAGKLVGYIGSSADGSTWTDHGQQTGGALDITLASSARIIRFFGYIAGAVTPTSADKLQYYDLRMLGSSLTEDVSGGFYGGTILRDLIGLVGGLTIGTVDDGSDYTIQAIERSVRDASLNVLQEVAGYYTREWAVWDDGRFDWKTKNLDEPQWTARIADCDELEIDATLDGTAKTVYVLYTDAASGLDAEASATATDQRNPYVRQAVTKDVLVSPGFPMTSNTSAQLASRIAGDIGARPSASGRCVIKANKLIANSVGSTKPAALIRGGDNVSFPELPKSDPFLVGRDGETLFHVSSTSVDLTNNTVTLELEGQQTRTDVILARLAASTRVLTG